MWDAGVIAYLQQFRTPLLDSIFRTFTGLGSDLFYMLLIPVVYWAVDRQKGHRLAVVTLVSVWLNGVVKEWAAMPRPDPALGIVRLAEATGPGFPSGHAQVSAAFWGWLALEFPRPWLIALAIVMVLGVSISRLYLGVHFLGDVLGGLVLGFGVVAVAAVVMALAEERRRASRGRLLAAVAVPLLLFPLSPSSDSERALGFLMGLLTADRVALNAIAYGEQAGLLQHLGRLAIGLAGFFALATAVRAYAAPGLPALFGYAVVAVWVAVVAPLIFLQTRLASPPREVQLRARQRRIPSIAAP
ncbi:MAG: phosphatase PAP2 family protein, partial [Bacillota bacterium]